MPYHARLARLALIASLTQPRPKLGRPSTRVEVRCAACPTVFKATPGEIKRGAGRYCSQECRNKGRSLSVEGTSTRTEARQPTVERLCEACGGTFRVYPYRATRARPARFCSEPCRTMPPGLRTRR